MLKRLKRILIGRPLKSQAIEDEKYGIVWGLPILSSDAISSVAYAGQEMVLVLLPAIGLMAYGQLPGISFAIIGLLVLLTLSYRQTIDKYPNGGGAYTVAKENLGLIAGVTAGAALSIDYILTVAVSISSAVEQITSAFVWLKPYTVVVGVGLVLFMMVGNLRGIRESSKLFGIPAYAFIFGIVVMLIMGIENYKSGMAAPGATMENVMEPIAIILLLRAFSNGCTALTGVEAVSNAVPNFKYPSPKHAKIVLLLLSMLVFLLFGGTSILAYFYQPEIGEKAMLIQLAEQIFGRGFMFYYIMATTFIILVMAANTAYSGFPLLVAVMAKEGYAPRQLSMRGDRLSYSNVKYSPFRKVVDPLLRFIDSAEYDYKKGDIITVILPQFNVKSFWHRFLHNYTGIYIQKQLLKYKHIVVSIMPLQLKGDDTALKKFPGDA